METLKTVDVRYIKIGSKCTEIPELVTRKGVLENSTPIPNHVKSQFFYTVIGKKWLTKNMVMIKKLYDNNKIEDRIYSVNTFKDLHVINEVSESEARLLEVLYSDNIADEVVLFCEYWFAKLECMVSMRAHRGQGTKRITMKDIVKAGESDILAANGTKLTKIVESSGQYHLIPTNTYKIYQKYINNK